MTNPKAPSDKRVDQPQAPAEHPNREAWNKAIKPADWRDLTDRQLSQTRQTGRTDGKPANGDTSQSKNLELSNIIDLWSKQKGSGDLALNTNGQRQESRDGKDSSDNAQRRLKDRTEGKIDPNYEGAKADCLKVLRERFKGDPQLPRLESQLASMETRMLEKEHVDITDKNGKKIGEVNQKDELRQRYENLALIARDAEKLTDDQGRQIFDQPWQVNKILSDAIIRGANPDKRFDQGETNNCANEKVNGIATALKAGEELRSTAQMLTTGKFEAFDPETGTTFTATVDKASMRLDREARETGLQRGNHRGAYGQMADLRTAQLTQSLIGRAEARERHQAGGEDRYTYKRVPTNRRNDTGERVAVNIRPGETFETLRGGLKVNHNNNLLYETNREGKMTGPMMSPGLNGETTGVVLQSLIGHNIAPDFGKSMVIASRQSHGDLHNATTVTNSKELADHVKAVEAKGWRLPIVATHVSNYLRGPDGSLGGAQGWHAWSVKTGANGLLEVCGSWGGAHEQALTANKLFSYMNVSEHSRLPANHPDRIRGDHVFYPDRPEPTDTSRALPRPVDDLTDKSGREKPGDKEHNKAKEEEKLAKKEQEEKEQKEREEEKRAKKSTEGIRYAQARLTEIEAAIGALSSKDSDKLSGLLAQKAALEHITRDQNLT